MCGMWLALFSCVLSSSKHTHSCCLAGQPGDRAPCVSVVAASRCLITPVTALLGVSPDGRSGCVRQAFLAFLEQLLCIFVTGQLVDQGEAERGQVKILALSGLISQAPGGCGHRSSGLMGNAALKSAPNCGISLARGVYLFLGRCNKAGSGPCQSDAIGCLYNRK